MTVGRHRFCLLHGYLLEGSGSNLWTRSIVQGLCRSGHEVHLVCQEYHPEIYDFVAAAHVYEKDGSVTTLFERETPNAADCILHKPWLGSVLPVYVRDRYEEFENAVPMIELPDDAIEAYLDANISLVERVVREHRVSAMHANHVVLMPVVAEQVSERTGVPSGIESRTTQLNLGVDTSAFSIVDPCDRAEQIGKLFSALKSLKRGREAGAARSFRDRLHKGIGREVLAAALAEVRVYDEKCPDAETEASLSQVDWERDQVLLFVGRLIASKGPQNILAALPYILKTNPEARFVLVGHGPLREILEAFVWALEQGDSDLAENLVSWGEGLEEEGSKPLVEIQHFFESLKASGNFDDYFETAKQLMSTDRVIFTGYLTHAELKHLMPCCDLGIFPSVVPEAGPLVFLEALASGVYPLGTYFAGMAASIDALAAEAPAVDTEPMKLSSDPERTINDIVANSHRALALRHRHADDLRHAVTLRNDWTYVADRLAAELLNLDHGIAVP
jgi:glycosyltransferase involved in cell wall biosynthesis